MEAPPLPAFSSKGIDAPRIALLDSLLTGVRFAEEDWDGPATTPVREDGDDGPWIFGLRPEFRDLGELGVGFIFITLGGQHATGHGLSTLLTAMAEREEQGYIELQRKEFAAGADVPTRSHHQWSGVPYHHLLGTAYDAARLGVEFVEALPDEKVV